MIEEVSVRPVSWLDVSGGRSLLEAHPDEDRVSISRILRKKREEFSEVKAVKSPDLDSATARYAKEVKEFMIRQGHKRILEAYPGMDGFKYVLDTMKTVCSVKEENGEIRRVNANLAPLSVDDFTELKKAGVGTYQCFQETYDPVVYNGVFS